MASLRLRGQHAKAEASGEPAPVGMQCPVDGSACGHAVPCGWQCGAAGPGTAAEGGPGATRPGRPGHAWGMGMVQEWCTSSKCVWEVDADLAAQAHNMLGGGDMGAGWELGVPHPVAVHPASLLLGGL